MFGDCGQRIVLLHHSDAGTLVESHRRIEPLYAQSVSSALPCKSAYVT